MKVRALALDESGKPVKTLRDNSRLLTPDEAAAAFPQEVTAAQVRYLVSNGLLENRSPNSRILVSEIELANRLRAGWKGRRKSHTATEPTRSIHSRASTESPRLTTRKHDILGWDKGRDHGIRIAQVEQVDSDYVDVTLHDGSKPFAFTKTTINERLRNGDIQHVDPVILFDFLLDYYRSEGNHHVADKLTEIREYVHDTTT